MTDKTWNPPNTAVVDGRICELRFRDRLGDYAGHGDYFLHDDGFWYRVDPPKQITAQVSGWRYKQ